MMEKKLVIAIDGYSSCGKSTFAKAIAKVMNYMYLDSGAMYRAVTLYCMRRHFIGSRWLDTESIISELDRINIDFAFNPETMEYETYLNSENVETAIRSMDVTN